MYYCFSLIALTNINSIQSSIVLFAELNCEMQLEISMSGKYRTSNQFDGSKLER